MTTLVLVLAAVLLAVAFGLGVWLGRASVTPTGAPTPQTANVLAVETADDADAAAAVADEAAEKKAQEILHATDDDTRDAVARLRARGRAGK